MRLKVTKDEALDRLDELIKSGDLLWDSFWETLKRQERGELDPEVLKNMSEEEMLMYVYGDEQCLEPQPEDLDPREMSVWSEDQINKVEKDYLEWNSKCLNTIQDIFVDYRYQSDFGRQLDLKELYDDNMFDLSKSIRDQTWDFIREDFSRDKKKIKILHSALESSNNENVELQSSQHKETVSYFDLEFDFENGEFCKKDGIKKFTLAVIDSKNHQTNYFAFKILLENKGQWLSIEDLKEKGFNNSAGVARNASVLFKYLKKLKDKFSMSEELGQSTDWIEFDKDKMRLRLIDDRVKK